MSQFDSMSPLMAESFRAMGDKLSSQPDPKRELVASVMSKIASFNENIVQDWLMSLDENSIKEVGELFKSAETVTPAEFQTIMKSSGASCPFRVMGDLIVRTKE